MASKEAHKATSFYKAFRYGAGLNKLAEKYYALFPFFFKFLFYIVFLPAFCKISNRIYLSFSEEMNFS